MKYLPLGTNREVYIDCFETLLEKVIDETFIERRYTFVDVKVIKTKIFDSFNPRLNVPSLVRNEIPPLIQDRQS